MSLLQIRTADGPADARHRFAAGGSHYRLPEVWSGAFSVTVPLPAGSGWLGLGARENILLACALAYQSTTAGGHSIASSGNRKGLLLDSAGVDSSSLPFFRFGDEQQKAEGISV